jgi:hypothetical protein
MDRVGRGEVSKPAGRRRSAKTKKLVQNFGANYPHVRILMEQGVGFAIASL